MEEVEMIECTECGGEGYNEYGPECNKHMSECCGGCYTRVECEECNGEGEIEKEDEDDN